MNEQHDLTSDLAGSLRLGRAVSYIANQTGMKKMKRSSPFKQQNCLFYSPSSSSYSPSFSLPLPLRESLTHPSLPVVNLHSPLLFTLSHESFFLSLSCVPPILTFFTLIFHEWLECCCWVNTYSTHNHPYIYSFNNLNNSMCSGQRDIPRRGWNPNRWSMRIMQVSSTRI